MRPAVGPVRPVGAVTPVTPVTPEVLLASADQLLTSPVPGLGSLWPRACALLIRLALELSLDRYWERVLPEAAECGMRQQLLLLPQYTRPPSADSVLDAGAALDASEAAAADAADAASLAREAWLGLAGAAHHHAYELAPTAEELRGWHTAVLRLNASLSGEGASGGCPAQGDE